MTLPSTWYRNAPDASGVSADVAERALHWLLELREDNSPQTRRAWEQWHDAHPDHARAWSRIESVMGQLRTLAAPDSALATRAALLPRRRHGLKALAVLAMAGSSAWALRDTIAWREWAADQRTGTGQRRSLNLPDGTRILLNTHSAVDVRFGPAERRLYLVAGEILITTAPDPHVPPRPFLVQTRQGVARALGTQYSVRQHPQQTCVNVIAGQVQIEPRDHPAQGLLLEAGRRARYTASGIDQAGPADERDLAWKDGFIVARGMRLADFLTELGRYTDDSLSCGSEVADLRVSGSFPTGDAARVLAAVAVTLRLHLDTQEPLWRARRLHLS
ncbi:FecR domain-containing protein [Bordetella genomosp. 12]|uniref:Histidine kinase n=1 Tax=Bordetella genomosp. 12 TaxID=463035 RepID=A0A261VUS8_9BORD|nr:FecR family protein [Bordetella genomosp. 12]OZI77856.1 histidine kinase [Bordetella genomosp. 12]